MRILIVDDHEEVARSLAALLTECGHESGCVATGEEALEVMDIRPPDLVLSDIRMPGMDGPALLQALHERWPDLPVAMMTAFGEGHDALEMMRLGAIDYFRKPIAVQEVLALVDRLASQYASCEPQEAIVTDGGPQVGDELLDGLVVHSTVLAAVIRRCDRVHGMPEVPVLIEGETGTGKELIARRVHHGGDPEDCGPFVALNCAAISPGLFESELFGHAPGAFTGAVAGGSPGKLALAAGGTIFLDEIGELPLEQQAKLLRALESRRWFPVGDSREQSLQARVVCASNLDLLEQVQQGRFREDLFYRLKVMRIRLPSLRETPDAVSILVPKMIARLSRRITGAFIDIDGTAMQHLCEEDWPGNIRQLWHVLEALCIESGNGGILRGEVVRQFLEQPGNGSSSSRHVVPNEDGGRPQERRHSGHLMRPERTRDQAAPAGPSAQPWLMPRADLLPDTHFHLDEWQSALIKAALEKNDNSPVKTAVYLGVTRKVLYTLRKRYGLMDD